MRVAKVAIRLPGTDRACASPMRGPSLPRPRGSQPAAEMRRYGKPIGRPVLDKRKEAAIRAELGRGTGVLKTARLCKVGTGTVQRIRREMSA